VTCNAKHARRVYHSRPRDADRRRVTMHSACPTLPPLPRPMLVPALLHPRHRGRLRSPGSAPSLRRLRPLCRGLGASLRRLVSVVGIIVRRLDGHWRHPRELALLRHVPVAPFPSRRRRRATGAPRTQRHVRQYAFASAAALQVVAAQRRSTPQESRQRQKRPASPPPHRRAVATMR
jgi:hypothetical protein